MKPTGVLLTSEEIGQLERTSARTARRKYQYAARAKCNGDYSRFVRREPTRGGHRMMFDSALLDLLTAEKFNAQGTHGEPPSTALTTQADDLTHPNPNPAQLTLSDGQALLPVRIANSELADGERPGPGPDGARRAWAVARKAAIGPLLSSLWRSWRGQTFGGISIQTMDDAVRALARDSEGVGSLCDWSALNIELVSSTGIPTASLSPVSASTLWRWYKWHEKGREIAGRLVCGLPALAPQPRADAGNIHLSGVHAEYLTSCYLGGDSSVTRKSLALERPRSAAECLELLKLEVETGNLPGPAPSYYVIRRWVKEALPRLVTDYARLGKKRALQTRGPHLVVSHAQQAVNDRRDWDFRRSNVLTWLQADGRTIRMFACGALDEASRDLALVWDLNPSTQLFKSGLRWVLQHWGVAREEWMDNGKEFWAYEVTGGSETRESPYRFEVDDECRSIFDHLHSEAHYCREFNPNGKALLERAFKNLDPLERNLPGWCGEYARTGIQDSEGRRNYSRPERCKYELKLHADFCEGKRPDTPLLHAWLPTSFDGKTRPGYIPFINAWVENVYRQRKHRGDGMLLRAPAQVQAAFGGERLIPRAEELDVLLWHRQSYRVHGDVVSFRFRSKTLHFRNEQLLALPGDCEVEVHVDPLNADRALANTPQGWIVLEPLNPTGGRSTAELRREIQRQDSLNKLVRNAALAGSRLAAIPGPAERMAMEEAVSRQSSVVSEKLGPRVTVELAEYAGAIEALEVEETRAKRIKAPPMSEERVFTSKTEFERFQHGGN